MICVDSPSVVYTLSEQFHYHRSPLGPYSLLLFPTSRLLVTTGLFHCLLQSLLEYRLVGTIQQVASLDWHLALQMYTRVLYVLIV